MYMKFRESEEYILKDILLQRVNDENVAADEREPLPFPKKAQV